MGRKLEYSIGAEWTDKTVREYMRHIGFSEKNITVLKRHPDAVLINNEPALLKDRFREGDIFTVSMVEEKISEKIPAVKLPFPIVYEDEDIVVVNKPSGMPVHPSLNNYENSLGNAAAWYFKDNKEPFVYRCINRLDRDTTGLTILAKHMLSASVLYDEMTSRDIKREYVAIVQGNDIRDEGIVDKPLGKKPDSGIERMVDYVNGERAITHYKVLERYDDNYALMSLYLETGRTHQIIVHRASMGWPLLGVFV